METAKPQQGFHETRQVERSCESDAVSEEDATSTSETPQSHPKKQVNLGFKTKRLTKSLKGQREMSDACKYTWKHNKKRHMPVFLRRLAARSASLNYTAL